MGVSDVAGPAATRATSVVTSRRKRLLRSMASCIIGVCEVGAMVVYVQCKSPTRQDLPVADMRVKREERELQPRRPSEEGGRELVVILSRSTFLSCRGRIERDKDEEIKQLSTEKEKMIE